MTRDTQPSARSITRLLRIIEHWLIRRSSSQSASISVRSVLSPAIILMPEEAGAVAEDVAVEAVMVAVDMVAVMEAVAGEVLAADDLKEEVAEEDVAEEVISTISLM